MGIYPLQILKPPILFHFSLNNPIQIFLFTFHRILLLEWRKFKKNLCSFCWSSPLKLFRRFAPYFKKIIPVLASPKSHFNFWIEWIFTNALQLQIRIMTQILATVDKNVWAVAVITSYWALKVSSPYSENSQMYFDCWYTWRTDLPPPPSHHSTPLVSQTELSACKLGLY